MVPPALPRGSGADPLPEVRFTGVLDQRELARVYNAADVFVFPSRTDTFGLVILEALACGCPVAAYPVTGPIDVIGDSPAGAIDEDLRAACLKALQIPPALARAHAERYSWQASTAQFLKHLCRIEPSDERTAPTDNPRGLEGRGTAGSVRPV